jgi:predicted Fe-S protein YdhL (DUF1289 family)
MIIMETGDAHREHTMTTTYTYDERIVSDLHKEVYGCRPREGFWRHWNESTSDEKQAIWDGLCKSHEEEMAAQRERDERAINEFEARVDSLVQLGADDRLTAIRWIVDGLELTENDLCYGADYVCYCLGLPYSCAGLFTEAVEALRQREAA